eukprot:m.217219 g.217219  ORF g.217219 m.217219 type:complete len:62 (+) comp16986_c19_seq6:1385-1570(+)
MSRMQMEKAMKMLWAQTVEVKPTDARGSGDQQAALVVLAGQAVWPSPSCSLLGNGCTASAH